MQFCIFLLILVWSLVFGMGISHAAVDDKFVTINNGHLYRDGVRLRQWGVNLQSGVFKSYNEIDQLVDRLRKFGFNAVRIWPTSDTFYQVTSDGVEFLGSKKGDGSALDRFDYLVFKLKESGFTMQMTMLHYVGVPALRGIKSKEIKNIFSEATTDKEIIHLSSFAPYVSSEYKNFLKYHIRNVLSHRNPYTGSLYSNEPSVSAWELANEASFVNCALADDCFQELPVNTLALLENLWKQSRFNPKKDRLPSILDRRNNTENTILFRKFISDLFISTSEDLKKVAKDVGGLNSGISKQLFIYSTWAGGDSAAAHYSYAAGDVVSIGYYHTPLDKNENNPMYPWRPISMGGTRRAFVENIKIKEKPLVIYESSFVRPYPYRAEWGPVMAAMALQQDWDSVFLYSYGQPEHIYTVDGMEVRYATKPLAEPYKGGAGVKGTYSFGFNHGSDPVVMASWMVGGLLFLNAESSTEYDQEEWWFDLESIWSTRSGYPKEFLASNNNISKKRISINFLDVSKEQCSPCVYHATNQRSDVKVPQVIFENTQLKIKTSGGEYVVGLLKGTVFSNSFLSAVAQSEFFGVFGVSDVNDPTDVCKKILLIGNVKNSDWFIDRQAASGFKYLDMFKAVESQGTVGLIKDGGAVLLKLISKKSLSLVDFNFREISRYFLDYFYLDGNAEDVFNINVSCSVG